MSSGGGNFFENVWNTVSNTAQAIGDFVKETVYAFLPIPEKHGGSGNDVLFGGFPIYNKLWGEGGDDTLTIVVGAYNELYGQDGNDTLTTALTGRNLLYGGLGNDKFYAAGIINTINGDEGDDEVWATAGSNEISGGTGNDRIHALGIFNDVKGGSGGDTIWLGGGRNVTSGGDGDDTVYSVAIDSEISGNEGNDTIIGAAGSFRAYGGGGNDVLRGLGLHTLMRGGAGNDRLDAIGGYVEQYGDEGDDVLWTYVGAVSVQHGGSGNDTLGGIAGGNFQYGDAGDDTIYGAAFGNFQYGGDGNDKLIGLGAGNIQYGEAGDDELTGLGGIGNYQHGGDGNDKLTGFGTGNFQYGDAGDDQIFGAGFGVIQHGGAGNDRLFGGGAGTLQYGDEGDDTLTAAGVALNWQYGGQGNDILIGGGIGQVQNGDEGNDLIIGNGLGIWQYGGTGSDILFSNTGIGARQSGGDDADLLVSGAGLGNFQYGEGGDDVMIGTAGGLNLQDGGIGNDLMIGLAGYRADQEGGAGDDTFIAANVNPLFFITGAVGAALEYFGSYVANIGEFFASAGAGTFQDGGDGNDRFLGVFSTDKISQKGGNGSDLMVSGISLAGGLTAFIGYARLLDTDAALEVFGIDTGDDPEQELNKFFDANEVTSDIGFGSVIEGGADNDLMIALNVTATRMRAGTGDDVAVSLGIGGILDGEEGADLLVGVGVVNELWGGDEDASGGIKFSSLFTGGAAPIPQPAQLDQNLGFGDKVAEQIQSSFGRVFEQIVPPPGKAAFGWSQETGLVGETRVTLTGDVLVGVGIQNRMFGERGTDVLFGAGLIQNKAFGGADTDFVFGVGWQNQLHGDDGDDIVIGLGVFNKLRGGKGGDLMAGIAGKNDIEGGDGSDIIVAAGLDDELDGDDGNDIIASLSSDAILRGGAGGDVLIGSGKKGLLDGGDGTDVLLLTGANGLFMPNMNLSGGTGNDVLVILGTGTNTKIDGGADNDVIVSTRRGGTLSGSEGKDWIAGLGDGVTLSGGTEGDVLWAGGTKDIARGEGGDDWIIDYDIDVLTGKTASAVSQTQIVAGDGDDVVLSFGDKAVIDGGIGNDVILVFGDDGKVTAGDGDDIVSSLGSGMIELAVSLLAGRSLSTTVDAALGQFRRGLTDFAGKASLAALTDDVGEGAGTLANGTPGLDGGVAARLIDNKSLEPLYASVLAGFKGSSGSVESLIDSFMDLLAERLFSKSIGSAERLTLNGGAGNDMLQGGDGNDILIGGLDADQLIGGAGIDKASYANALSAVVADLSFARLNVGEAAGDTYQRVEGLVGSAFDDSLFGNSSDNLLDGGAGNDLLVGRGGRDQMLGGAGIDTASYAGTSVAVTVDLLDPSKNAGGAAGDTIGGVENLVGSDADDILRGDDAANVLTGGKGADRLEGRGGIDTASYAGALSGVIADLVTPAGNGGNAEGDTYLSIENLVGSDFADTLRGGDGSNALSGGNGDDTLEGRGGNDRIDGGAGSDTASYATAAAGVSVDLATGAAGGAAAGDVLVSIENLIGSAFADSLVGNDAANRLEGGAGGDLLSGGGGLDLASYANATAGVTADLATPAAGTGDAAGDSYVSIEGLAGSRHADRLFGNEDNNSLEGGAGGDMLDGRDGDDILTGGLGADRLYGNAGVDTASYADATGAIVANLAKSTLNSGAEAAGDGYNKIENLTGGGFADTLTGNAGINRLDGGAGDDTLTGGGSGDMLVGGTGLDTASYASSTTDLTADLSRSTGNLGDAAGDTYSGIENLRGGSGRDTLRGTAMVLGVGGVVLQDGANRLDGGAGDDILEGLAGDDILIGGFGADRLVGGDGVDTASYATSAGGVTVDLDPVQGSVNAGADAAGDSFSGIENIVGSAKADDLRGDTGNNQIYGGDGMDRLTGRGGDDLLDGGAAGDRMSGGMGDDRYIVDNAADIVIENANDGNDTVVSRIERTTLADNVETLVLDGAVREGTGNALANTILGNAADNIFGVSAGNDSLFGGAGNDVFSYTSGFNGFANGTVQRLSGGDAATDETVGFDTVALAGPATDYNISVSFGANSTDWSAATTTVTRPATGSLAGVTLVTSGVELATFTGAVTNGVTLGSGGLYSEAARLAKEVYGKLPTLEHTAEALAYEPGYDASVPVAAKARGWHTLSALELGMRPGDFASVNGLNYTMIDGFYMADRDDQQLAGDRPQANALVLSGVVNGKSTLSVTFRGTDQFADWADYADFSAHYAKFAPLIEGLLDHLGRTGVAYDQILVSGHSLGAGVAQYFAKDLLARGQTNVKAITFGSPGSEGAAPNGVAMTNFVHTDDLVSLVPSITSDGTRAEVTAMLAQLMGGDAAAAASLALGGIQEKARWGSDVRINSAVSPVPSIDEHAMGPLKGSYMDDVARLETTAFDTTGFFYGTALAASLRAGEAYTGPSIELTIGYDTADVLKSETGDDYVLAGAGDDIVYLDRPDALRVRAVEGGTGSDWAVFGSNSAGYTFAKTGDGRGTLVTDKYGARTLLYGVEWIAFTDGMRAGSGAVAGGSGVVPLPGSSVLTVDPAAEFTRAGEGDFTIQGSTGGDRIIADAGNKTIYGNAGDDIIILREGAGGAGKTVLIDGGTGADLMSGGAANETFIVDNIGDTVSETDASSIDRVRSSVDFVLGNAIEHLTLTGRAVTGVGNALGNVLAGNGEANVLKGLGGDDTILGGAGADRMSGGEGIDTAGYAMASAGVSATLLSSDQPGAVTQTGEAAGDVLDGIENLTGSGFADVLQGDGSVNVLAGGDGDDVLIGNAGGDSLVGGDGRDAASYANAAAAVLANLADPSRNRGIDAFGDVFSGIEDLIGSAYADILLGDAGNNRLEGGAGGDRLTGGGGSDTASYSGAADGVTADLGAPGRNSGDARGDSYSSIENLEGSALADTLTGDKNANRLSGGDGDDRIDGAGGLDTLAGGIGDDTYVFSRGTAVIVEAGGAGWDTLVSNLEKTTLATGVEVLELAEGAVAGTGTAAGDVLKGNSGANTLSGGDSADTLVGNEGDDTLDGGAGADRFDGGSGFDTVTYRSAMSAVTADLAVPSANAGDAGGDRYGTISFASSSGGTLSSTQTIENLTGSAYGDTLRGDKGANRLDGGRGADTLEGRSGGDTYIVDNVGDQVIEHILDVNNLRIDAAVKGDGDDTVVSGVLRYVLTDFVERLVLSDGAVFGTGNALANTIEGNAADNRLAGGTGDDTISGADGDDHLSGNGNSDKLTGGAGDDVLEGGSGWDRLDGGEGIDTASYATSLRGVIVDLKDGGKSYGGMPSTGTGADGLHDEEGDSFTGVENLAGSVHADSLTGDVGANALFGGEGDDTLSGGDGNDRIEGGRGSNTLSGDGGDDTIVSSTKQGFRQNGSEYTLERSSVDSSAGLPKMAALDDGGHVLVWQESGIDGGAGLDIRTSIQTDNFIGFFGTELTVNKTLVANQSSPVVTALSDGRIVIAWTDESTVGDTEPPSIKARILDSDGTVLRDEFVVNSEAKAGQSMPAISELLDADGLSDGFVIVWRDASRQGADKEAGALKGQMFSADGTRKGQEITLNSTMAGDQGAPSVTAIAGGGFALAWEDRSATGADKDGSAIKVGLFGSSGAATQGGEILVNTASMAGDQVTPAITSLVDGGFVVTWQDAGTPGGVVLRAAILDAEGAIVRSDFAVDPGSSVIQTQPTVTALANGGFVTVWMQGNDSGTEIRAKAYDKNGLATGADAKISQTDGYVLGVPSIVERSDGSIVIAWQHRSANGQTSIREALFSLEAQDRIDGGSGIDTLQLDRSDSGDAVILDLTPGSNGKIAPIVMSDGTQIRDIEQLAFTGGSGADRVTGGARSDTLAGGRGNDTLSGGVGNDVLDGGAGRDALFGGKGDDTLVSGIDANGGTVDNVSVGNSAELKDIAGFAGGRTAILSSSWAGGVSALQINFRTGDVAGATTTLATLSPDDSASHVFGGAELVALGNGTSFAVWTVYEYSSNAPIASTFGQRLSADGSTVGEAFAIAPLALRDVNLFGPSLVDQAVAVRGNHGIVVVAGQTVAGQASASGTLAATLFANDGTRTAVVALPVSSAAAVDVIGHADGSFSAVWVDAADQGAVQFHHYTAKGVAAGSERIDVAGGPVENLAAVALSSGGFAMAWSAGVASGYDGRALHLQVFDAAGIAVSSSVVLADADLSASLPDLMALPNGGFAAVWTERLERNGQIPLPVTIVATFDAEGHATGTQDIVWRDAYSQPQIALASDGSLIVSQDGGYGTIALGLFEPSSADDLDGGDGTDLALIDRSTRLDGFRLDLSSSDIKATASDGSTFIDIERLHFLGGAGIDRVVAGDNADRLSGGAGDDILFGSAGTDDLSGGIGRDTLQGGDGADVLEGGANGDRLVGGADVDTASYRNALVGLYASLDTAGSNTGDAAGDTFDGIENLTGSAFGDVLRGDANANMLEGGAGADRLYGGDGFDTATYASATAAVTVELVAASSINTGDAKGDRYDSIENATGSDFADVLIGNSGANTLHGGAGDDIVVGGGGADRLFGGTGQDMGSYERATDGVLVDLMQVSLNTGEAKGDKYSSIEHLAGSGLTDDLRGDALANALFGAAGDDTLSGRDGDDTLIGGKGADKLIGGLGFDTASYRTAAAGVRVDFITVSGNTGDAAGDRFDSIENLIGGLYNDTLVASTGANRLEGLTGDDLYVVDHTGDIVIEHENEGRDTARVGIAAYTLADHFEDAVLDAAGRNIIGNGLANTITGNGFANQIDGGRGADTMAGGAGDDTYTVDDERDIVTETANSGRDRVLSFVGGYTLTDNVERLLLGEPGAGGSAAQPTSGSGNALANEIAGNSLDNRLEGAAGDDTLFGRDGDDILAGGAGMDSLFGGKGNDTADYSGSKLAVTASLADAVINTGDAKGDRYDLVENLTGGKGYDRLFGDGGDNVLRGNDGNDRLDGGVGSDQLIGGTGSDTAIYGLAEDGVVASLDGASVNTGDAQGDSYSSIENIEGTRFDDGLTGDSGRNILTGGSGNDRLDGLSGKDTLSGGDGNDVLVSTGGAVRLGTVATVATLPSEAFGLTSASMADGGTLLVWRSATGSLFSQVLDAAGNRLWTPSTILTPEGPDHLVGAAAGEPKLVALGNDTFLAVWGESGSLDGEDRSGASIMARLLDSVGQPKGNAFLVNTTVDLDQAMPTAASGVDGTFAITWRDAGDGGSIRLQVFDTVGRLLSGEGHVSTTAAGSSGSAPSITGLADGRFVVSWTDEDAVRARLFDADGTALGAEITVAPTTGDSADAVVTALAGGGFAIVLQNAQRAGSVATTGLSAQIYGADGALVRGDIELDAVNAAAGDDASVVSLKDGGFAVAWLRSGASGTAIVVQTFSADGAKSGPQVVVASARSGETFGSPTLALQGDGELAVNWSIDQGSGNLAKHSIVGATVDLAGSEGGDILDGGNGLDHAVLDRSGSVVDLKLDLGLSADQAVGDGTVLKSIDSIDLRTGRGNDTLAGGKLADHLDGGAGNDVVRGGDGNDVLYGGSGTDTLQGGIGDDRLTSSAADLAATSDARILTGDVEHSAHVAVADLGGGAFVLAWNEPDMVGNRVNVQIRDVDGHALTLTVSLGDPLTVKGAPSLVALGDGTFVVAWSETTTASGGDTTTVLKTQHIGSDGSVKGEPVTVEAAGGAGPIGDYHLASKGADSYAIVWQSAADGPSFAQVFDTAGAKARGSAVSLGEAADISIAATSAGYMAVIDGPADDVLRARLIKADGAVTSTVVSTNAGADAELHSAVTLADGSVLIAWRNAGDDSLHGRIIGADGRQKVAAFSTVEMDGFDGSADGASEILALPGGGFAVALRPSGTWSHVVLYEFDRNGGLVAVREDTSGGGSGGSGDNVATGFTAALLGAGQFVNIRQDGQAITIEGMAFDAPDTIDGGSGTDTAVIERTDTVIGLTLNITNPASRQVLEDGTTIVGIEMLEFSGGRGDDWITGGILTDTLKGGAGDDNLRGGKGDDILVGGDGSDLLAGGDGDDTLSEGEVIDGGTGVDLAILDWSEQTRALVLDVTTSSLLSTLADGTTLRYVERLDVTGGSADDIVTGGAFADRLAGNGGNDTLHGGNGTDTIDGGAGRDKLFGDASADVITGGAGNDELSGGSGNDRLDGGTGNDVLYGEDGDDVLVARLGGSGADAPIDIAADTSFVFGGLLTERRDARVAMLKSGGFVATWTESISTGDGLPVVTTAVARVFDGAGRPLDLPFDVGGAGREIEPEVIGLEGGGFVVVWEELDGASATAFADIYYQVYSATGAPIGGETLANVATRSSQSIPTVTALKDGGFAIAWASNHEKLLVNSEAYLQNGRDLSGGSVQARLFDGNGNPRGGDILVNEQAYGLQTRPDITTLDDGRMVVTWSTQTNGSGGTNGFEVAGRIFSADGVAAGGEFRINSSVAFDQGRSSIAGLTQGGFVATWLDDGGDGSGFAVKAQRFAADGSRAGGAFTVNARTAGHQMNPKVMGRPDGGFVVVWEDYGSGGTDGDGFGVVAQVFDANGRRVGADILVNASAFGDQRNVGLTVDDDGSLLVSYTDGAEGGAGSQVLVRRIDLDGADVLVGGDGIDTAELDLSAIREAVTIDLSLPESTWQYLPGATILSSIETLRMVSGAGADSLTGGTYNDVIDGGDGDDIILGRQGVDRLSGGGGRDTIDGGDGNDVLDGGAGRDRLTGGIGNDELVSKIGIALVNGEMVQRATATKTLRPVAAEIDILDRLTRPEPQPKDDTCPPGQICKPTDPGHEFVFDPIAAQLKLEGQHAPRVEALANGGWVLVFTDYSAASAIAATGVDTDGAAVKMQIFNADGSVRGTEILVNSVTDGDQKAPSVTELADGRIVVAWEEKSAVAANGFDIKARIITAEGVLGQEIALNGAQAGSQSQVTITGLDTGGFVAAWTDLSGGTASDPSSITLRLFDALGTALGTPVTVETDGTGEQALPSVVAMDGGDFALVWQSRPDMASEMIAMSTRMRIYDGATQTYSAEITVGGTSGIHALPVVARVSDAPGAGVVVVWTEEGADGAVTIPGTAGKPATILPSFGLKAQIFTASGTAAGEAFLVNTTTAGHQGYASVATLPGGGFVVVWQDAGQTGADTSGAAIRGQVFDAVGNKTGTEFLVNTSVSGDQIMPTVTGLTAGTFVVSWQDSNGSGGASAVRSQLFSLDGPDVLDGGEGDDLARLDLSQLSNAVILDLRNPAKLQTIGDGTTLQNIERIDLISGSGDDQIRGGMGIDSIKGGRGIDRIWGEGGNDLLDGGAGADQLNGGTGNDTFMVDDKADRLYELTGEGDDTLVSSVSYVLAKGVAIETLRTSDIKLKQAIDLIGNAFDNSIFGNAGANTLKGDLGNDVLDGGKGIDLLMGGKGDDTLHVDNRGDQLSELAGEGNDTVVASVSYALAQGVSIETLRTSDVKGKKAIDLTGNALNNRLLGNAGSNVLKGEGGNDVIDGGTGKDLLDGGTGNDTYVLGSERDTVIDSAGNDTITSTVNRSLEGYGEIENLVLLTDGNLEGTGNGLANKLTGNIGSNILDGSTGSDVLTGRSGTDTFVFASALGTTNVDRITDFSVVDDTIRLDASFFAGLAPGALSSAAFKDLGVNGAVLDADDRIVYNSTTGVLSYDKNGSGSGGSTTFALLDNFAVLSAADFFIVA